MKTSCECPHPPPSLPPSTHPTVEFFTKIRQLSLGEGLRTSGGRW